MTAYKIKKTGNWAYKFMFQGVRYKREGYLSRDAAVQAEGLARAAVKAPQTETPSISWLALATEYLTYCKAYMRVNTWRQKAFVYREFLAAMGGDLPAREVTPGIIRNFLTVRLETAGPKAANRSLRDMKALFNWAIDEDLHVPPNPCKRIMDFDEEPYRPYVPPAKDVAAVKLAALPDERDFIEVLYHAIARKGEAENLTWEDVNFERRTVRLWTRKRRGGKLEPQDKPMNDTLYQVLHRRWLRRDKSTPRVFSFTPKQLRVMMADVCERAEVKPFGFHAIRHHVLSVINDSGKATTKQIQELAGHKRQTTTEIYLHSMGRAVRDAAAILDGCDDSKIKSGPPVVRQKSQDPPKKGSGGMP